MTSEVDHGQPHEPSADKHSAGQHGADQHGAHQHGHDHGLAYHAHDHLSGAHHEATHEHAGHDHEDDAACEVAHGTVPAPLDGRVLVAVFATPVAQYLLRYAADAGYRPVLVEPDTQLAKEADAAGFDVHPGIGSVPDTGTDVVVTDHH